mgnify:FL=1
MADYEILKTINSPKDVKDLSFMALKELCDEMRAAIINRVSKHGGHLGPNLGVVELTTALHYVFDSPNDKLVWDVSHQSYPHKLLTGRAAAFYDDDHYGDASGYTAPQESEHDIFTVGHTSTSVSLASGLAKARDLKGGSENVIAIIGDGSLSGGEAFEGLDNVGAFKSNFIVIVNDNEMSIAKNYGGLYGNLAKLRETKGQAEDNYFKALGFDYVYVDEGNDVVKLITELMKVKDSDHPVVVHVHTLKGCGYQPAVDDKESFHWTMPFDVESGKILPLPETETYADIVADYMEKRVQKDRNLAVVTAGTPGAVNLGEFRTKHPDNYFDVGIAEEHAIAFLSGMAKAGLKPAGLFYGGFIQRTYDQLSQDLCLNNSPAVLVLESCGLTSMDATHLSVFDIPLMSNIPNLVYLAPTCKDEALRMLDWAFAQKAFPVALRMPAAAPQELEYKPQAEIELNKFEMVKKGSKIALLGLGNFLKLAEETANLLKEKGVEATIINPRFTTGLDKEMLTSLLKDHEIIVTLEDGVVNGGFGEKIASFYGEQAVKVYNFGADKEFTDRVAMSELLERYSLTAAQIVQKIL